MALIEKWNTLGCTWLELLAHAARKCHLPASFAK
ncbi:hypothetical protein AB3S75_001460 [Citrus x aurantiifolia]